MGGKDTSGGRTECAECQRKAGEEERRKLLLAQLPEAQENQRDKWFEECNIPALFVDKTFANFEKKLQPKAYDIMRKYDGEKSIVLLSPDLYGVGKTHLIAALVTDFIEKAETAYFVADGCFLRKRRCPIYFIAENSLLSRIRQTYNRREEDAETEEDVFSQLGNYSHLLIDDVGKVRPRDYSFLQGVYFRIIDSRYTNELPIILTTNLGYAELENHIGGASADRLREMAGDNFVLMKGVSYRIKKTPAQAEVKDG